MGSSRAAQKDLVSGSFIRLGGFQGIEEYQLKKNGLRVLYSHDTSTPVVGVMVNYLVGSRYEVPGNTGATHILEHLMFKGSKKFPPKKGTSALDTLSKKGAKINADTWCDRTRYYEVFPKKHFEFVLELEADRMRHASITKPLLEEELPAVLSEYAMSENDPVNFLDEQIWAAAFTAHGYHHSTIGHLSDIQSVTVEKLTDFYDTYYHPNNAVVSIVGDVTRTDALQLVKKYFGVYARDVRSEIQPTTTEPKQTGLRHTEVSRAGTKNIVGVGFKVPRALHRDTPAMLALNQILVGSNTARLKTDLVETGKVSEVFSHYVPFYDESLLIIFATPSTGYTHEQIRDLIISECDVLTKKDVTATELQRVVAQYNTEIALARDGHLATLYTLNEGYAVGDWRFYYNLPKQLKKINPKDVRTVAKKYFTEKTMTTGFYRAQQ